MGYWGEFPPTHMLVGAYMGMGRTASGASGSSAASAPGHSDAEMDAFFMALGDVRCGTGTPDAVRCGTGTPDGAGA